MKAVAAPPPIRSSRRRRLKFFAPLRFLSPAEFDRVIKEAEVGFRQLWKELPWGDK